MSPFMGMDSQYEWRIRPPENKLCLSVGCTREGRRIFHADLYLKRLEITETRLVASLMRRPVAAVHVLGGIYYQALKLRLKKCQFFPHPKVNQKRGVPMRPRAAGNAETRGPE